MEDPDDSINEALKRLSNGENLNQRLIVVTPYNFLAVLGLIIALALFLLFAFFTHLTIYIEGKGVTTVDNPLTFQGFVPYAQSQPIQKGQKVLIEFKGVNKQEFGQLWGVVTDVSHEPLDNRELLALLPNATQRGLIVENMKAPTLVKISAIEDPNTKSGYRWTIPAGPPFKIDIGRMGTIQVVIDNIRTIDYIFPVRFGEI